MPRIERLPSVAFDLDDQEEGGDQEEGNYQLMDTQESNGRALEEPSWLFSCSKYKAVAFFGQLGVLSRILLANLQLDEKATIAPLLGSSFLLPNLFGCSVMALLARFEADIKSRVGPDIYTGLTTGYCGCLTTFASMNNQLSLKLYEFALYDAFIIFSLDMACYYTLFMLILPEVHGKQKSETRTSFFPASRKKSYMGEKRYFTTVQESQLMLGLFLGFSALWILLGFFVSADKEWTVGFVVLSAPVGGCTRAWLSQFNGAYPNFPFLGTFIANIGGVIITSVTYAYISNNGIGTDSIGATILATGIAGSLSTISTFVHELVGKSTRGPSWIYCLTTFFCSSAIAIAVHAVGEHS
jgi:fluoride ion exporter CrcB/FEX